MITPCERAHIFCPCLNKTVINFLIGKCIYTVMSPNYPLKKMN